MKTNLQIQGRMQIFEENVPEGLKSLGDHCKRQVLTCKISWYQGFVCTTKFRGVNSRNTAALEFRSQNIPKTSAVFIKYCGCCKRGCKYKAACKFSKKMSQEALNRVLTLPDYRARCTDHFAGSGSKIENKNISVVRKQWKYRISVPMLYIMRISKYSIKV